LGDSTTVLTLPEIVTQLQTQWGDPDEGSYYRLLNVSGHTLDSLAAAVLRRAAMTRERPSEIALLLRAVRPAVPVVAGGLVLAIAAGFWLAHRLGYALSQTWLSLTFALIAWMLVVGAVAGRQAFHLILRSGQQGPALGTVSLAPGERRRLQVRLIYPADATPPQVLSLLPLPPSQPSPLPSPGPALGPAMKQSPRPPASLP
jgi:uncharacterized membrane protein